jgi:hypothetical protein
VAQWTNGFRGTSFLRTGEGSLKLITQPIVSTPDAIRAEILLQFAMKPSNAFFSQLSQKAVLVGLDYRGLWGSGRPIIPDEIVEYYSASLASGEVVILELKPLVPGCVLGSTNREPSKQSKSYTERGHWQGVS